MSLENPELLSTPQSEISNISAMVEFCQVLVISIQFYNLKSGLQTLASMKTQRKNGSPRAGQMGGAGPAEGCQGPQQRESHVIDGVKGKFLTLQENSGRLETLKRH